MGMRVLVVGGGAREHALVWKLAGSPRVGAILCAPGNAGTAGLATNLPVAANDLDGIVAAAGRERIDLVVIGPEEPLARGLADRLGAEGVLAFGPTAAAARIETSKSWAKDLLREAGVPAARSVAVTDVGSGMAALADFGWPLVLKADGLAAGKGVVIVHDREHV
ncbi:MAG: phosphoribosylamine--glycine ligase, partial [Chloroflexota bacterium]|nr:phosphoribosylamine--glycine ligase [Chloroflexota bacterium]